jgi:hypothetical protein
MGFGLRVGQKPIFAQRHHDNGPMTRSFGRILGPKRRQNARKFAQNRKGHQMWPTQNRDIILKVNEYFLKRGTTFLQNSQPKQTISMAYRAKNGRHC